MDRLQCVVRLHHRVLVSRTQAAGGAGRLHPAQDGVRGHTQASGYSRYRRGHGVKECTTRLLLKHGGQIHNQLKLVLVKSEISASLWHGVLTRISNHWLIQIQSHLILIHFTVGWATQSLLYLCHDCKWLAYLFFHLSWLVRTQCEAWDESAWVCLGRC